MNINRTAYQINLKGSKTTRTACMMVVELGRFVYAVGHARGDMVEHLLQFAVASALAKESGMDRRA